MANRADIGSEAIPGPNPSGTNIRLDPDFEKLQAEVGKGDNPSAGPPDWRQVVKMGVSLTQTKSKDLLVASYLCMGLLKTEGLSGLADGLAIFRDILRVYWDTCFPEVSRMRGRVAALRWLSERVGAELESDQVVATRDSAAACAQRIEELSELLRDKFPPDAGADISELRRTIGAIHQRYEDEAAAQAAAARAAEAPAPPETVPRASTPEEAEKAYPELRDRLLTCLDLIGSGNPANPWIYRLRRGLAWLDLVVPPATDGRTPIPGPEEAAVAEPAKALEGKEFARLLQIAEAGVPRAPFWLDLNRYVATALEGLGHAEAARAVLEETAALVRHLPALLELKFENGVSFADENTRAWLQSIPQRQETESDGGKKPDPAREILRKAKRLAGQGKTAQAAALLQKEADGQPDGRERFQWTLQLGKLLLEAGETRAAVPILESLERTMDRHALEEWDPSLCIEVVKLLLSCYKTLSQVADPAGAEFAKKRDVAFARLCRLSAAEALGIGA